MKYGLVFVFLSFTVPTYAAVYQCNVNGSTVFQSKPCAGSQTQQNEIQKRRDNINQAQQARLNYEKAEAARVKPRIGMSKQQAENSTWGYPNKVNTTTTSNTTNEQWVYRMYRGESRYLYFTNGVLTSMQE